jgi:hypothetical protein
MRRASVHYYADAKTENVAGNIARAAASGPSSDDVP